MLYKTIQFNNSNIFSLFIVKRKRSQRGFCVDCSKLVVIDDVETTNQHENHVMKLNLSISAVQSPSKLLAQHKRNKQEAQYHFRSSTTLFLVNLLKDLGLTNLICIGTTTIHECIQQNYIDKNIRSILLDIDDRYSQFYLPSQFIHFNMFNYHFFDKSGLSMLEWFLRKSKPNEIALIVDPPFGGLMEALSQTVLKINELIQTIHELDQSYQLKVLLIMPYYLEKMVVKNFQSVYMSDYRIIYMNHRKLKNSNSSVRLFTNIEGTQLRLPEKRYKFCTKCQRYVSLTNVHCDKCKNCTASAKPMKHCDPCGVCRIYNHFHRSDLTDDVHSEMLTLSDATSKIFVTQ